MRREARYQDKLALLEEAPTRMPTARDERLDLIFMCCHPALARDARIALTLRSVLGLTTAEIARAFLTSESTLAQRIVRAKRKIVDARIALRRPEPTELVDRLDQALAVVYLVFNEGYLATGGPGPARRDLMLEADRLASEFARALPDQPDALGLLAMIHLHLARADSRFDERGRMILLEDQDRSRWDRARIADAVRLLDRAGAMKQPGPYQVQAAIAALHAEAPSWSATDWPRIRRLYDALVAMTGSPVVRLNRAIALREVAGAEAAPREADGLAAGLDRYHLLHATRAELLRDLGRRDEAHEADRRALELTENPAERALLEERIASAET